MSNCEYLGKISNKTNKKHTDKQKENNNRTTVTVLWQSVIQPFIQISLTINSKMCAPVACWSFVALSQYKRTETSLPQINWQCHIVDSRQS